jgi:protease-4
VPDFIHIGDFKTATNQLTEKRMTAAHREMSESLNRDMFAQLVRAVAEGRRKSEADVRALIDDGPFLPKQAVAAGLVDGIAYEDELDDLVPVLRYRGEAVPWIEADEYTTGSRRRAPAAPSPHRPALRGGHDRVRPQRFRPDRRRDRGQRHAHRGHPPHSRRPFDSRHHPAHRQPRAARRWRPT